MERDAKKALQRFMKNRGADLGSFGPNGDGIDGDFSAGGKSDTAFRFIFAKFFDPADQAAGGGNAAGGDPGEVVEVAGMKVSRRGLDQVVEFESGGFEYYHAALKNPVWPKGFSGVTIGFGYDLGYNERAEIRRDWEGRPSVAGRELEALVSCSGIRGDGVKGSAKSRAVKNLADSLEWIGIDWSDAAAVFEENSVPRFATICRRAFPGVETIHADAAAMLLSLVFNRGGSMKNTDRRREMRNVRALVPRHDYRGIAREIRSMKRLWRNTGQDGLLKRRDLEADLIERCAE